MSKSKIRHLFDATRPSSDGATQAQTCAIGILANRRNARKSTGQMTLSTSLGAPADLIYAKQTQFPKTQNERNLIYRKGL